MAADRNGMQRFLSFRCAKVQWKQWLRSLPLRISHHKESDHEQEQDGKPTVIHGIAGARAPHSENHEPTAVTGSSAMTPLSQQRPQYQIRFQSLYNEGRALTFPCDAQGRVEMDALSEKARMNYLYARAVVGREFAAPAVLEAELH